MTASQPNKKKSIAPVILAGGEGKRLRPLTSKSRPKPFLKLFSNRSLLQETLLRVRVFHAPLIVLHHDNHQKAEQALSEIDIQAQAIICEPENCLNHSRYRHGSVLPERPRCRYGRHAK